MAGWSAAQAFRDATIDDWLFDTAEETIGQDHRVSGDPQALFITTPVMIEIGNDVWNHPIAMLLTQTRMVLARKKGLGHRAETLNLSRYDFFRYSQPSMEGNRAVIRADHRDRGVMWFYYFSIDPVEALATYFKSG